MSCCPCRSRRAFTLLEVVVGLTLMASVLVGSLLAFSAHHKQRRMADAKLAAVRVADALLHELSSRREGIPISGRGAIAGRPNWFWQTSVVAAAAPAQVLLRVVRLEIVEVTPQGSRLPLATVEVVRPVEP